MKREANKDLYCICVDNTYTWRNCLTVGKKYEILKRYICEHSGLPMVNIVRDDGEECTYRANRFSMLKRQSEGE